MHTYMQTRKIRIVSIRKAYVDKSITSLLLFFILFISKGGVYLKMQHCADNKNHRELTYQGNNQEKKW